MKPDFTNTCQNALTQENNCTGSTVHFKEAVSINIFQMEKFKRVVIEMEYQYAIRWYFFQEYICSKHLVLHSCNM